MPIPTQTEMFGIVLDLMSDRRQYSRKEMKRRVLEELDITASEALEKTDSGVLVYESRVGWSISYLSRAKLIDRVRRGIYVINEAGLGLLAKNLNSNDFWCELNNRINTIDPWVKNEKSTPKDHTNKTVAERSLPRAEKVSPYEQIRDISAELNADLASELLAMIMENDSDFFEKVVIDLLEKMGYGKGTVTKRSCDGGIDGLITTDELGFRPICTQAKRYAAERKVGRPEVQSFVGALNGANNGVFITTSTFTSEARDYAAQYPNATLSLIDGKKLSKLLIKYDLGVTTESVIEIKRIDSDYFEDR